MSRARASNGAWKGLTKLDPASPVPLYYQLGELLRTAATKLEPNTKIPSEKELMDLTGVSRATARRAVAELVHEGVLFSRQGRGTFVASPRIVTGLEHPAGFSETMRRLGRTPSTNVLSVERVAAPRNVAEALSLPKGSEVWVVERLRRLDGEPCMLERAHVPAAIAPDLDRHDLSGSLYELLADSYGLQPAGGSEVIIAVNADRELAQRLTVPLADALLTTARTTVASAGAPIEYTLRHARGDMCSFRVTLDGESTLGDHSLARTLIEVR